MSSITMKELLEAGVHFGHHVASGFDVVAEIVHEGRLEHPAQAQNIGIPLHLVVDSLEPPIVQLIAHRQRQVQIARHRIGRGHRGG